MKKTINIVMAMALFLTGSYAHAYSSQAGTDPRVGGYEVEYKSAVKNDTDAGYKDALSKGSAVYYDVVNNAAGAYVVTLKGSGNGQDAQSSSLFAGIAARDVATGDVSVFNLVTRGYIDYGKYDATSPITVGDRLCIGTAASVKGILIGCSATVQDSVGVALESKASGTGSTLKALIKTR